MLFMLSALSHEIHLYINNNECAVKNDLCSFVVYKALTTMKIALLGKKNLMKIKLNMLVMIAYPKENR